METHVSRSPSLGAERHICAYLGGWSNTAAAAAMAGAVCKRLLDNQPRFRKKRIAIIITIAIATTSTEFVKVIYHSTAPQ
jgi:hypothetical protein